MADNRIVFRAGESLTGELEARSNGESLLNLTAKRDLERYYYVLSRSMPELSENDALLLCDILNGAIFAFPDSIRMLPLEVEDADESCFLKWGVEKKNILDHVRSLSVAEMAATIDAVERYWKGGFKPPRDVGLCK